ncbi:hypothetical protein [Gorillibacterium sp. CAU 1737]|uniref:hypothetical protein n=1 Tax=Gorillibacterium sp. CAU 1737 TaxID=3140362 RepID=UPI0032606D35
MNNKRKLGIGVISFLIMAIFTQLMFSLTGGSVANAESVTVPFSYDSSVQRLGDGSYGPNSFATAKVSFSKQGYTIKRAFYKDLKTGYDKQLVLDKTGNWSGNVDGLEVQVESNDNFNQGWYAWDRSGGASSNVWRAQGSGACTVAPLTANSGGCLKSSTPVTYSMVSGYKVPDFPGVVDTQISYKNKITMSYFRKGTQEPVNPSIVAAPKTGGIKVYPDSSRQIIIKMNDKWTISERMSMPDSSIQNLRVTNVTDSLNYEIRMSLDFNQKDIYQPWSSPGAAMMVYIYSFKSTAESVTYRYPYEVTFEIEKDPPLTTPPITTPPPGQTPTPEAASITGDFDILPGNTIEYRESVALQPKDIRTTGTCTYRYHEFRMVNGATWTSSKQTGKTDRISFTYPDNYPAPISAGTVTVQMKVTGSNCSTDWITKTLYVKTPANNHPPFFKLGWFIDGDYTSTIPLTRVVEGTKVMVRIIDDPNSNPVSPSDPDGDPFNLTGWDFSKSTSWVSSLPDQYSFDPLAEVLSGIETTSVGYQRVYATLADTFGASYTAGASLEVVPKNPIPVIEGPKVVKENRPVPEDAFSSAKSYSPTGRKIDHAKDEWTNKQTMYTNGTDHDIQVTVKLHVWDDGSPALKSLSPAEHILTVQPDLPPIGKLDVAPLTLRGLPVTIYNKSYSPDGDPLVAAYYWYKYDANNNGFDDDGWQSLPGTMEKATFTPTKVGKYLLRVRSDEERKQGSYGEGQLDTINQAPTVSFVIEGKNEQPQPPNRQEYPENTILTKWSLMQTNTNTRTLLNGWGDSNNVLTGGSGKKAEDFKGYMIDKDWMGYRLSRSWANYYTDAGYGSNGLNPYRTMTNSIASKSQPLLADKDDGSGLTIVSYTDPSKARVQTTRDRIYYEYHGALYAMNKERIPDYELVNVIDASGPAVKIQSSPTYKGASPIDYKIIAPYSYTDYEYRYQVADSTIYQVIRRWDAGAYKYEIRTYDLNTGQFIAKRDGLYGYDWNVFGHKDNLQLILSQFGGWAPTYKGTTIDRNANIVREATLPLMENIRYKNENYDTVEDTYRPSEFFQGVDGEFYIYEMKYRSYEPFYSSSTVEVYIDRFNSDYSLAWRTRLPGPYADYSYTFSGAASDQRESLATMSVNPITRELLVRSYSSDFMGYISYFNSINMDTGASVSTSRQVSVSSPTYRIESDGSYSDGTFGYANSDGLYTSGKSVKDRNGNTVLDGDSVSAGGTINFKTDGYFGSAAGTNELFHSQYVGDGILLSYFTEKGSYPGGYAYTSLNYIPWLSVGTPSTTPQTFRGFSLGQFMSNTVESDTEFSFMLTMDNAQKYQEDLAGFSFRMQDGKNRYAVETSGTTLYLVKYINGTRSVLSSRPYPFQNKEPYNFKLKALGSALTVSVNGVPMLSASDSTFASGKFGPFSDKEHVSFSGISTLQVVEPDIDWFTGYAIWEPATGKAEVRYSSILYSDPENDPKSGDSKWNYQHKPRFLNNQGLSAMNGKTFTGPQVSFDKVGDYLITLQDRDDPNPDYLYPNMRFAEYRMDSNAYQVKMTVHRRPVADFTLKGNPDGTISWTDTSYDPDRWISDSNYSTESTGIDYRATRGIMERKYTYASPSGVKGTEKLVRPTEKGVYSVTLQVRDEYGAWSEPVTREIGTTVIPPANIRPTVYLTHPSGAKASPSFTTSTRPTVSWNQWDDSGWIRGYQVKVSSESGTPISESGEVSIATTAGSWSWQTGTLPRGQKLQVQVRVTDGEAWSDWSNIGWIQVNQPPSVTLTNPIGTKENPQKILDELRPTLHWTTGDPDVSFGARTKAFRVLLQRANGDVVYDSGTKSGDWPLGNQSMKVPLDLPTNVPLKVMVRTYDGDLWSEWSNEEWLFINRRPSALISYPAGTAGNPTVVARFPSIVWTQSDPDPRAVFPLFRVQVYTIAGTQVYDSGNLAGAEGSETWEERAHELTKALTPGQVYKVQVRVYDGYDWGEDSPFAYMVVNRAPTAELVIPSPIYEQDTPTFALKVSDPDGDLLHVTVEGVLNGERVEVGRWLAVSSGTTLTFPHGPLPAGMHSLSVRVTDPYEERFERTWTFPVLPLAITGEIHHTPEWENQRERWNAAHPKVQRAADVFWAGEALVLQAVVTDTGTDTRPERVTARLMTHDKTIALLGNDRVHFRGTLNDPALTKLDNGEHWVRFTAYWTNGAITTTDVPFRIKGSLYQVVVNQTRH